VKRSKLVKGKLYEFHDLPIETSRAITETWVRKEGREYTELLAGLWRWDGGGNWTMVKRVT
jgi:hypothetical protein